MELDKTRRSLEILKAMIDVLLAKKEGIFPPDLAEKRVQELQQEAFDNVRKTE